MLTNTGGDTVHRANLTNPTTDDGGSVDPNLISLGDRPFAGAQALGPCSAALSDSPPSQPADRQMTVAGMAIVCGKVWGKTHRGGPPAGLHLVYSEDEHGMLVAIHLENYGSCRILSGDALKELWAREASIADEEKLNVDADPELKDARPHEHKAYETRGFEEGKIGEHGLLWAVGVAQYVPEGFTVSYGEEAKGLHNQQLHDSTHRARGGRKASRAIIDCIVPLPLVAWMALLGI